MCDYIIMMHYSMYVYLLTKACFIIGHYQRCRKDFLIGGTQYVINSICSTGHIEWAWHRLKTWGGGGGGHVPPVPPWFLHL